MPSCNAVDTGFDVTRHESEPTSDRCFVVREHEELPVGGKANGDDDSIVDRCALHPTGKVASREYRKGGWISMIRSPGRWWSSAFEGLEPYEGKLSRTVLRGALGW